MKRITDFIVDKRYFILTLVIILAIIAQIFSEKVTINYDISKYLPSTSETRTGMDIMEKEFSEVKRSSLNLMFKGLSDTEKTDVYNYLKGLEGIESIEYDETEEHNKKDYTLYEISVQDEAKSEIAANVYNSIMEKYNNYELYTSGDVAETNGSVLEMWIILLAVGCALLILIFMCESYVEPFLFLIAILIAILLNKGTNVIFDSVSHITQSISAILQLALSMDYSIMLMNRYIQEKNRISNKIDAMKEALYHSLSSISSSSVTTIVGLLALIFMSFTIGKDLGFVLAKGVLFSLISIFLVLPALILMCDKLIEKTKKKIPNIKMGILGKTSYKCRYIAVPLFLVIFLGSFLLKGNLKILYTSSQQDKIAKVFTENNQIAVIYKNEDEERLSKILLELEAEDNANQVLGYSNTINEKLAYSELNQKLDDLGSNVNVEDYLLKILYYNYYNKEAEEKMTFNDFITFIKSEVYNNPKVSNKIDENTKANIDRLENFTTEKAMNTKRSANQIAKILEIDESKVNDILIYYSSKNDNIKIGLDDFVKFMNKDVITNPKYSESIDDATLKNLNTLSKFTDKEIIQNKINEKEMAQLFGLDENMVNALYKYYISVNEINTKMTLAEFSNFVLNDVLANPEYKDNFSKEVVSNIQMLAMFSNINTINQEMSVQQLSKLFGINDDLVSQILLLKYMNSVNAEDKNILPDLENIKCSPYELVNIMLTNETISSKLDRETLSKLKLVQNIMNSELNNINYTYEELSNIIGVPNDTLKNIYMLYTMNNVETKITPKEFVDFILVHQNDELLSDKLSKSMKDKLQLVKTIMNDVINNKKYFNTELARLLGIDKNKVQLLYGLYSTKYINTNKTISLKDFVNFLLTDVITNPDYSNNFTNDMILKLNTINDVMIATANKIKYNANKIIEIINVFTNDIDKNMIDLLYIYYGSIQSYDTKWQLTVEEFVNYLNEDILKDNRFKDFIDDEMRNNITEAKETITDAKKLLVGKNNSRVIMNTKFSLESEQTFNFVQKLKDLLECNEIQDAYVIGNSPMAYEMSKTFNDELNFITILTMIAIFVVVAITFKSVLIPIILVLIIQSAVYTTMGMLSFSGEGVYFIALLIVQSILMGATIDYAIVYTSYYLEHRKTMEIKEAIINSYNKSIHTILTSGSILIIVTLIVANFASAIAAQICKTISAGTLCSVILILVLLPAMLAGFDKFIIKDKKK